MLQQAGPRSLDLLRQQAIEGGNPQAATVMKRHGEAAAAVLLGDLRVEHPGGVLTPVVLRPLEPGMVGIVLGTDHTQPLGPGEGSESPA